MPEKEPRNRKMVPPIAVNRAIDELGLDQVASALGYTASGLRKAISDPRGVIKVLEIAAGSLVKSGSTELVIVRCDRKDAEQIAKIAHAFGAKAIRFVE